VISIEKQTQVEQLYPMQRRIKYIVLIISLVLISGGVAYSQTTNKYEFERIEDNSFLMEEAYNQEAGVIQHISSFQLMNNHTWSYTFTDEWPVPGQVHQLSATIPVLNTGSRGLGDVELNYRYQAILRNRLAFSPRISLVFPTGNYKQGLGTGTVGYQLSLPLSYILTTKIVTHYNLGVTFSPGVKYSSLLTYNQTVYNYGLSMIFLLSKTFNLMIEAVGYTTHINRNYKTQNSGSLLINPGFRYAINFKSGLQIVPGMAVPIGIGPSKGDLGLFAYLSFEHPLWKP
jgi:hypothetical protein